MVFVVEFDQQVKYELTLTEYPLPQQWRGKDLFLIQSHKSDRGLLGPNPGPKPIGNPFSVCKGGLSLDRGPVLLQPREERP